MTITTPKELFVTLLSDLRQGAERSTKIYEELGQAAKILKSKRLWKNSPCLAIKQVRSALQKTPGATRLVREIERTEMDIPAEVRKYIADRHLYVEDDYIYGDDASFIQEGLLDSMGIMELVTFVQNRFQIELEGEDITPENFDSINKLTRFIERKRGWSGSNTEPDASPRRTTKRTVGSAS